MRFPIDLGSLRVRIATPPVEDRDYETQQVRERDGKPLYQVELTVLDGKEADQVRVRVPGPLADLAPDDLVQVHNLRALHWQMGERSGCPVLGLLEARN